MLQLLIGRSGSGKTSWILSRLTEMAAAGQENMIWLVPEQHSFESERMLLTRLGPALAARVQVVSFSRLADHVFREVGGVAGERLDDGTRALLMSRALEQVAAVAADTDTPLGGLRPYLSADSAYVEQLLTLWSELRQCAVSTESLDEAAEALALAEGPQSLLAEKTAGLYQVYTAYEGLAGATGLDDLDRLTRLAECLPNSRLVRDAAVFVDGFKGFTQQELLVLDRLIPMVRELTVALGTDTPGARWPGVKPADCRREYPLFSPVTDTIQALQRLAGGHGKTWDMTTLAENRRTDDPALRALEEGLYRPSPVVYDGPADGVTVTPCPNVYEECRYVTRQIRRLLRQEGLRCRDITVVARNLADYQGILDEMLTREGITCYMDTRRDLLCEPLVVYIRSALRLAVGGLHTEEILRLLKTDLWPLSPVEIAELENYVYTWRIDGRDWDREWTQNPSGLDGEMTSHDRATLRRLNSYRAALMASLIPLRRALTGPVTGRRFAGAVYDWLSEQKDLPQRIARQVAVLEDLAQPVLAAHAARLWDEMMTLLDRFVTALGDQRMPAGRMEDLFTMLCRMIDLGTLPQGLDAVTVGSADRIRYNNPRVVFVLGANEGVFPAYPVGDGLLTEEERRQLKEMGLTLAQDVLTQCVEERYHAYMALAAPRERLFVTYLTDAESGESPLVTAIRRILPGHIGGQSRLPDGTDLESAEEMFERLAYGYANPTPLSATLRQVVGDQPDFSGRLAALSRSVTGIPFQLSDEDTTQALYGTDMCLSASRTEQFYRCRFSYFCRYGLQLQSRRVAEVDAMVFGTLVHYAMESLLPEYTAPDGLVDQLREQKTTTGMDHTLMSRLQRDVERVITGHINDRMGGMEEKSGRFRYRVNLAQRAACNMLWHTLMELRQSQFTPVDYELDIHPAEDPDAQGVLSLRLPVDGGSVQVRGKVDRVDLFRRFDGTTFVRVVDYKTGSKKFELYELTAGLSMQMLLYLFIICENSGRYAADGVRPGGVLYHPLSDLIIDRGQDNAERLKQMCMSGLVLDDPSVVLAMEAEGNKHFIPANLNKEGRPTGNVVTADQFALLRGLVEDLLTQMARRLLAGDIEALPLKNGEKSQCAYCDYRAICGRDPDAPVNQLEHKRMAQVLEELEVTADE